MIANRIIGRRDTWHEQVSAFSQTLTNVYALSTTDAVFDGIPGGGKHSLTDCFSMHVMRREAHQKGTYFRLLPRKKTLFAT